MDWKNSYPRLWVAVQLKLLVLKKLDIKVCGYDIFDILVNYWQVQLSSGKALADHLEQWKPIKTQYTEIKSRLKAHWNDETLIF